MFLQPWFFGKGQAFVQARVLLAETVSHFLAPAGDGAQQRQAAVKVGNHGYPTAALAIAAAAPTACDTPLTEEIAVQHGTVEACAPGK